MVMEAPPFGTIASLLAGVEIEFGVADIRKSRTFSVTCRATYNALATSAVRVNVYFSPNGVDYDTVPFTYFDVDLTAGATVQETHNIDVPEHGYFAIRVKNNDSTYAALNVRVWTTKVPWPDS